MRAAYIRLGLVLVVVLLTSVAVARNPTCVDDYGNPDRLVIDGCKFFTPEALKASLSRDLETLMAAHPAAPLDSFRDTLRRRIVIGYQHSGFPEAKTTVRIDQSTEKIHVNVEEGHRYIAEGIEVKGNRNIPTTTIKKWLTSSCPPAGARLDDVFEQDGKTVAKWVNMEGDDVKLESPVWKSGEPATFDKPTIEVIRRRTRRAMADLGYFFPVFNAGIVPQEDSKNASLVIEIFVEGPKAILGEICIKGNKNNTREEIIDYLKLKPGEPIGQEWKTVLEERLWRSGRFINSYVSVSEPPAGSDRVKLNIKLVESPWAPRLSEPLSPEQVILLKLREWLTNPKNWDGDFLTVIQAPGATIEIVVSPTHGILGRLHSTIKPSKGPPQPVDVGLVLGKKALGVFCPKPLAMTFCKNSPIRPSMQLTASLGLKLNNDTEQPSSFTIGVYSQDIKEGNSSEMFQIQFRATPALLLALPKMKNGTKCILVDGVLNIDAPYERYRVEAKSGRLLEFAYLGEDGNEPVVKARFQQNAFQDWLKAIREASADCPNKFDPDAPWNSVLAILCDEKLISSLAGNTPETLRYARFLQKMQQMGVFDSRNGLSETYDRWQANVPDDKEDYFMMPWNLTKLTNSGGTTAQFLLAIGLSLVDEIFPRQSWPWTLARETMLMSVGQTRYTREELQDLLTSDNTGPIFHIASAAMLDIVSPQAAKYMAVGGLEKLSVAYFQKDCRVLLGKDYITGKYAHQMARAVRDLNPQEVKELLGKASSNDTSPLGKFIEVLRSQPKQPIEEAIMEALTAAWNAGLREQVKAKLSKIRDATSEI